MADPSLEDLRKLMETAEGREALKNILEMETDGGGTRPMQLAPEFVDDTVDEVGYDPDIGPIDIGASPDNPGATRGLPQDFSPYQDPQILDQDPEMPPPGTQAMDPNMMPPPGTEAMDQNMTLKEMERRKMLAQLMANQQTITA
jgi:hypothetical protein